MGSLLAVNDDDATNISVPLKSFFFFWPGCEVEDDRAISEFLSL